MGKNLELKQALTKKSWFGFIRPWHEGDTSLSTLNAEKKSSFYDFIKLFSTRIVQNLVRKENGGKANGFLFLFLLNDTFR
jgi:hypothetical protein